MAGFVDKDFSNHRATWCCGLVSRAAILSSLGFTGFAYLPSLFGLRLLGRENVIKHGVLKYKGGHI
jgi:hypothetical protein